jgi:hypothetical protein
MQVNGKLIFHGCQPEVWIGLKIRSTFSHPEKMHGAMLCRPCRDFFEGEAFELAFQN